MFDLAVPMRTKLSITTPLLVLFASMASAQTVIKSKNILQFAHYNTSMDATQDLNGDGVLDFIVGRPEWAILPGDGRATVYSGKTGTILHNWYGTQDHAEFGTEVTGLGDLNGDGVGELMVTAPEMDVMFTDQGQALIFDGATGATFRTHDGLMAGGLLGSSCTELPDLDGDGVDEYAVGCIGYDLGGPDSGSVTVYSGSTGTILHQISGTSGDELGAGIASAGDVDGDNVPDLLLLSHEAQVSPLGSGVVQVHSGATGALLYQVVGTTPSEFPIASMDGIGDIDGDGLSDFALGMPLSSVNGIQRGLVRAYSGVDGSTLWESQNLSENGFGTDLEFGGDVNGDGVPDLVVAAHQRVFVVSSSDGTQILAASYSYGIFVSAAGDVNGNGRHEILRKRNGGSTNAYVETIRWDPIALRYCSPAVPNSTGQPASVHAYGSPVAADNHVVLAASDLPPSQFGYFLTSMNVDTVPMAGGSQGTLCLGGAVGRYNQSVFQSNASGGASLTIDLTQTPTPTGTVPVLVGESWSYQAWYRDVNPVATSNFTDALTVFYE